MIVRVFRMRVKPGMHDVYERLMREEAIPKLRAAPGLLALQVGKPLEDPPVEFLIYSIWDNLASLRAFVGPRWREPLVFPGESSLVLESIVDHYELMESHQTEPDHPVDTVLISGSVGGDG